jgi:hypothetical protein
MAGRLEGGDLMSTPWVTLDELKNDQSLDGQLLARDDAELQRCLNAAMVFVRKWRPDVNYSGAWTVPEDIKLGTLRLAAHWSVRKSIDLGDLGERRVHNVDPDIRLQLGIRTPRP